MNPPTPMNPPAPTSAMVLAAGGGERMRPLTETTPKPLLEVAGKALIDHVLDRRADAGGGRAVVNLWHLGAQIERHLAGRAAPRIAFSREASLLDTGGGVAKALPLLGAGPFFVLSSDTLWREAGEPALERLAAAWDDGAMDALLLLQPTDTARGFEGAGDFFLAADGGLARRGDARSAPFAYMSVQLMHSRAFEGFGEGAFSNNRVWDRALANRRLFGLAHDGDWFHVGTPENLTATEGLLR